MSSRALQRSFLLDCLSTWLLGRFQNHVARSAFERSQRALYVLLDMLFQIRLGRGPLRQDLVVEVLNVECVIEFSSGVISKLHEFLLTQHVRGRLAGHALVTSYFLLRKIRAVPSVLREIPKRTWPAMYKEVTIIQEITEDVNKRTTTFIKGSFSSQASLKIMCNYR